MQDECFVENYETRSELFYDRDFWKIIASDLFAQPKVRVCRPYKTMKQYGKKNGRLGVFCFFVLSISLLVFFLLFFHSMIFRMIYWFKNAPTV